MGFGKFVRKAVRKVTKTFHKPKEAAMAPEVTPAPELDLVKAEGEAEEKQETEKKIRRKGKRALKISKDAPVVSAGRNII